MVFFRKKSQPSLICLILMGLSFLTSHGFADDRSSCSAKWKVTGYFTPVETDYPETDQMQIKVEKSGYSLHSSAFLDAVKTEGWGRTRDGWYLGRFSNKWHKSQHPLNSLGEPLRTDSIATDQNIISTGTHLTIPTLPNHLKQQRYVSDDVGSAIKNLHIDIYTGEGRRAEKMTYEITGKDHTVCRVSSI